MSYKTYKGDITELKPNQIFVFGSNTEGRHGMGAALWAKKNAGAIQGQAKGFQGQSYAIVTKDLTKHKQPSIPEMEIIHSIIELYMHASFNGDKEFLIPYKAGEKNINAYSSMEMAAMFATAEVIGMRTCMKHKLPYPGVPSNIVFEEGFAKMVDIGTRTGIRGTEGLQEYLDNNTIRE